MLIEYLKKIIKPQKQAGYFDDEENIYYCFLQNNDLNVVIKSEEIRRNIEVIINNPTEETEKQFDQIAMSLSNYLEENLGKALK